MDKITISAAELELMKVLWQATSPLPVTAIIENVQKSNDWSKNTVATMLDRLVKKSAVNRSGNCRSYLYTAALPENEYKSAAVEKLAGQFFSGSVGAMFNFFAEDKKLTSEDVAEIKKLIEKMESQNDC